MLGNTEEDESILKLKRFQIVSQLACSVAQLSKMR